MDSGNTQETLDKIAIDLIDVEGQMVRSEEDIDHIHNLALSITRVGLLNPVTVIKKGKRYNLVAGYHRLEAVKYLKWKKVAVTVLVCVPGNDVKSVALVENIVRKQMTIEEECKAIEHMVKDQELSVNSICSLLGKTREYVLRRQMASNLHEDVRVRLFEGSISLGVAEELGRIDDKSSRGYILWQAVQNRFSLSEVRDMAKIYLESPSIQTAVEKGDEAYAEIQRTKTPQRLCDVCSARRDYRDLMNIWVCRDGCDPKSNEDLEKGVETNG